MTSSRVEYRQPPDRDYILVGEDGSAWRRIPESATPSGHKYIAVGQGRRAQKTIGVHRLILETFVGPCPERMEARHKDGDPSNNRLDNLAWGTRTENAQDRVRHRTQPSGSRTHNSILTEEDIPEIWAMSKQGIGPKEIGRKYGVSSGAIQGVLNGTTWKGVPREPEQ